MYLECSALSLAYREMGHFFSRSGPFYPLPLELNDPSTWKNFIERHNEDWWRISTVRYLPSNFVDAFSDKLCLNHAYLLSDLSEMQIEKYHVLIGWNNISSNCRLSESFIEKHKDEVNWDLISRFQKLRESFMEKFADFLDWKSIVRFQELSEAFIERFQNRIDWNDICCKQKLSEDFIERYQDRVNWLQLSMNCSIRLSESFYEKFSDRLYWNHLSINHRLTELLIEKFVNLVDWKLLSKYQDLSDEFITKHADKIDKHALSKNCIIVRRLLLNDLCWNVAAISEKTNNHFSRDVANEILEFGNFSFSNDVIHF